MPHDMHTFRNNYGYVILRHHDESPQYEVLVVRYSDVPATGEQPEHSRITTDHFAEAVAAFNRAVQEL